VENFILESKIVPVPKYHAMKAYQSFRH